MFKNSKIKQNEKKLSYTRTRKLRTLKKRKRTSMPWVINTAAASRAGIGITGFFTAITRVVQLAHTFIACSGIKCYNKDKHR